MIKRPAVPYGPRNNEDRGTLVKDALLTLAEVSCCQHLIKSCTSWGFRHAT